MGIGLDEMPVWDYRRPFGDLGGNALEQLERSRVILWKGHCSVHARFTVEQIEQARADMGAIAAHLEEQFPNIMATYSVNLVPLHEQITGSLLVTLDATGHCPQLSAPRPTAEAISSFAAAFR